MRICASLICTVVIVASLQGHMSDKTTPEKPRQPAEPSFPTTYSVRKIEGWTVRVDDRLLQAPHEEMGKKALRFLENKLFDITMVVPKTASRSCKRSRSCWI